ncbi:MAG: cytochrome C oxidase subunit IV family protein [Candidatus Eisenbacteria bacterium]
MSDHGTHPEGKDTHEAHGHAHPTAKKYLGIAIILTIITVIEVAVFYVPSMHPFLPPILLSLSALKFALVAMFYMHLKFDHRLYSWVFIVPMCFATAIILALLALFSASHRS